MRKLFLFLLLTLNIQMFNTVYSRGEKILSYSLDSLLVTLTHSESMLFKDYTANDFGIEEFATVECLNDAYRVVTREIVDNSMNIKSKEQYDFYNMINVDDYHCVLEIKLFEPSIEMLETIENELKTNSIIKDVEKNYYITLDAIDYEEGSNKSVPTQSAYDEMNIDDAIAAYNNISNTTKVNVCILDTGVMSSHEDFNYVDQNDPSNDYCVVDIQNSYDFINNSGYTTQVFDSIDHGTGIAGIIGAIQNNGVGIDGICSKANIISYKVHQNDCESGLISNCISALNRALSYSTTNTIPIQLFNCSFNFSSYSSSLESAMRYYPGLFVCSAGNTYLDLEATPSYPACFNIPNLLCVGALKDDCNIWIEEGPNNEVLAGSNYGNYVNLYAFGHNVYTLSRNGVSSYMYSSGTSLACPYVTGAVSLLLSMGLDIYEAKQTIISSVVPNYTSLSSPIVNVYSWSNPSNVHSSHSCSHVNTITDLVLRHSSMKCSGCDYLCYFDNQVEQSYTVKRHYFYCEECGAYYNDSHKYEYLDLGLYDGHNKYCKHCSYYIIQNHNWIYDGLFYICSGCGSETTFLPIIHD